MKGSGGPERTSAVEAALVVSAGISQLFEAQLVSGSVFPNHPATAPSAERMPSTALRTIPRIKSVTDPAYSLILSQKSVGIVAGEIEL